MPRSTRSPELQPLEALVGTWATEATHPAYPDTVVAGQTSFEWLQGQRFLIQRSNSDHPDFPDSISVIGAANEGAPEESASGQGLLMHYFDSRGVHRVYDLSLGDGHLRISRDAPGFSQRFDGAFGDGGETISGVWRLSRDDSTWDDDLEITFRRVREPAHAS